MAPSLLVRQHLIAEYRELPRIYALVRDCVARGETPAHSLAKASAQYTLGKGHCRFFYARLGWLTNRYLSLVAEMQQRGYNPSFTEPPEWTKSIQSGWYGDWQPTPACVAVNVERINTRLVGMGLPHAQLVLCGETYQQQRSCG